MEWIVGLLIVVAIVCIYLAGYYNGRADGIKWTRDVYDGKHDDEIFPPVTTKQE